MANKNETQNNTLRGQIRDYQQSHPGTKYTAARAAVLAQPQAPADVWSCLLGQPDAREMLRKVTTHHLLTQEALRRNPNRQFGSHLGLLFTGPPGTGKSTAAALLARSVGTPEDIAFVSRKDLVGRYIGHTDHKVASIVQAVKGGIVAVRGAGELLTSPQDQFGREAVIALASAMRSGQCTVILMDSAQEFERLMGLGVLRETWFLRTIEFTSLDTDSLVTLANRWAGDLCGAALSESACAALAEKLDLARKTQTAQGVSLLDARGNAHLVLRAVETAWMEHSSQIVSKNADLQALTNAQLCTIQGPAMSEAMDILLDL